MIDVYLDPPQPGPRIRTDWNQHLTSRLCELHGDGLSFAQVGERIGFSRNACIGRFNRLSLEAGRAGLTKDDVAESLSLGNDVDTIANCWGVEAGAVEARLAEIRRALGPQAR